VLSLLLASRETAPKAAAAEFPGPDRGPPNTARRRVCQPTDSPDGTIRQAVPLDPVLKPVNGAAKQKREVMRPKKTILCVDDNEQVLSVRTFLLETRGYRVIALTDPHQALEVIANSLPGSLDLLLSDLVMPQMDGNELVRRAKDMHPQLPALIVSGTVTAYDRAGRADVFLPKGACTPAELLERIRILVARKRGPKKYSLLSAPPMAHSHSIAAVSA
jgi:CheY-like chemotaxis protein